MKITWIAEVIQSIYYDGRPKADRRLSEEDFLQMARMVHGDLMRKMYYELRQTGNQHFYFGAQLRELKYKLEGKGKKRYIELEEELMRVPDGLAIAKTQKLLR
jgi:hypothetical protein